MEHKKKHRSHTGTVKQIFCFLVDAIKHKSPTKNFLRNCGGQRQQDKKKSILFKCRNWLNIQFTVFNGMHHYPLYRKHHAKPKPYIDAGKKFLSRYSERFDGPFFFVLYVPEYGAYKHDWLCDKFVKPFR